MMSGSLADGPRAAARGVAVLSRHVRANRRRLSR
jgi:hypothetical protein